MKRENIADLVSNCRKGSRSAQYRLYLMYSGSMFSICRRFIDNSADAEEILQDSFVKAFTKIGKLKDNSKFGSWLKKITINECVNFIKKKKIVFEEFSDSIQNIAYDDEQKFNINPELVNKEIANLPDGCRVIFNLYLIENYKHKEIAKMLNITESTSKSQYQRAKQLLKNRLTSQ